VRRSAQYLECRITDSAPNELPVDARRGISVDATLVEESYVLARAGGLSTLVEES